MKKIKERLKNQMLFLVGMVMVFGAAYFVYNSFAFPEDIKIEESNRNYIAFSDKTASKDIIFKTTPTSSSGENYYVSVNLSVSNIINKYKGKTITINFYNGTSEDSINNKIDSKNIINSGNIQLLSKKNDNSARYYRVEFLVDGKKIDIRENNLALTLKVIMSKSVTTNYSYTNSSQTFTAPYDGSYRIELWGAQGNYYDQAGSTDYKDHAGKGAYTAGTINLTKGQILYIYIGQNATTEGAYYTSSFNGGSQTIPYAGNHRMSSGGGASDVRLVAGAWNDPTSLASRIMVAGGGGGTLVQRVRDAGIAFDHYGHGGSGGGLVGYRAEATHVTDIVVKFTNGPYGGSQTAGGLGGGMYRVKESNGKFGIGGNGGLQNQVDDPAEARRIMRNYLGDAAYNATCNWDKTVCGDAFFSDETLASGNIGGGGGGGYYGGGGGGSAEDCHHGGAGGSSYISGHTGSIATINNGNLTSCSTSGSTPEDYVGPTNRNCSFYNNNSSFAFSDTVMIDGEGYGWTYRRQALTQMPNPNGGYYALGKGHEGTGAARITATTGVDVANATYTKSIYDVENPELDIDAKIDRVKDVIKSEVTIENNNPISSCQTQLVIPIDADAITNIRNIKVVSTVKYTPTPAVVKDNKITITLSEPFKKGDKVTVTYDADQKDGTSKTKIDLNPYVTYYPSRDGKCYTELIDDIYKQTKTDHDDTPVVGTIKIIKTDSETNKVLPNTVFGLYDKNGKRVKDYYGNEIKSLITDKDGSITIRNLLYNTYYLKEEKSSDGYYLMSESIPVTINSTYYEKEVKNNPIKITIIKEDYYTKERLEGAKFTIYDVNNKNIYREFITTKDTISIQMVPGEYIIKEKFAPAGYQLSEDEYRIMVTSEGLVITLGEETIWEGGNYKLTIYNEPTQIVIDKKDIKTGNNLSGATLTIYDKDGNIAKDTVTKEEMSFTTDGEAKWYYIAPGEYTIKETESPEGYDKIENDLNFEVTANGNLVYNGKDSEYIYLDENYLVIYNGEAEIPVPNTGLYVGIGTIILGGAFAYVGYRLIKKKED